MLTHRFQSLLPAPSPEHLCQYAKGDRKQPRYKIRTDKWNVQDTYTATSGESTGGTGGVQELENKDDKRFLEIMRNLGFRVLDEPTNVRVVYNKQDQQVEIKWTDPIDLTDNKPCPVEWAGTVVVRAEGKAPLNPFKPEYEIMVNSTTRDEYSENPFVDTIDTDKDYVYAIMPYDTEGHYRYTKSVRISIDYSGEYPEITSVVQSGSDVTVNFSIFSSFYQLSGYLIIFPLLNLIFSA